MDRSASLVFGLVAIIVGITEFFLGSAFTVSLKSPANLIHKIDDPNYFYFLCGIKLFLGGIGIIHFFYENINDA